VTAFKPAAFGWYMTDFLKLLLSMACVCVSAGYITGGFFHLLVISQMIVVSCKTHKNKLHS